MSGFNSTLVRLKEKHPMKKYFAQSSFNSTLVRLKAITQRMGGFA